MRRSQSKYRPMPTPTPRHRQWRKDSGSWEWTTPLLRVTLHRYHGMIPVAWFVSCHQVAMERKQLAGEGDDSTAERAQAEALEIVRARLTAMLAEMGGGALAGGGK